MAFISCPKCKKTISDKVESCPHCGTPKSEFQAPAGAKRASKASPAPKKTSPAADAPKTKKAPAMQSYADQTASETVKRFLFHTVVAIIGFGIAYLLGGLAVDLLEDTLSLNLSTVSAVTLFMTIAAVIVAVIAGVGGPIATADYSPEEKGKIVRARPKPLHLCCILYYVLAAVGFFIYFSLRKEYAEQLDSVVDEKIILSLALSLAGAVYLAVFGLCSNLHVLGATCRKCGHVSCRVKIGESTHKSETSVETRERTYGGASYDVYDSSGAHIGTATGPDTTATERRTVTTEHWDEYFECHFCKHHSSAKASKTTKESWHR